MKKQLQFTKHTSKSTHTTKRIHRESDDDAKKDCFSFGLEELESGRAEVG